MPLSPSAHVDPFCRQNLPPADQWPDLIFDESLPQYPDRLNCGTALLDDVIASHGGDRPCLLAPGGETWTYDQLRQTANRIAALLGRRGVVPGNRVLLRGPNNPWLIACWFGGLKAGAVVVTTMPMLRRRALQDIHEIASIDLALCDHRFADDVADGALGDTEVLTFGGSRKDDLCMRVRDCPT